MLVNHRRQGWQGLGDYLPSYPHRMRQRLPAGIKHRGNLPVRRLDCPDKPNPTRKQPSGCNPINTFSLNHRGNSPTTTQNKTMKHLPFLLIVGLIAAFRILGATQPGFPPNFQPLAALFFCGMMLSPGGRGFLIPLGIWAATYCIGTQAIQTLATTGGILTLLGTLAGFAATAAIGKTLFQEDQKPSYSRALGGAVIAALAFHLITNGLAWTCNPMYAKNGQGLIEALWSGPQSAIIPTWVFLRNFLAANLLFTGLITLARRAVETTPEKVPQATSRESLSHAG
jgi:hypothetical protein